MPPKEPVKTENVNEPEVKLVAPETPQKREDVTLDAETGRPVAETPQAQPSISQEELQKIHRRMEFQARQYEKSMQEMRSTIEGLKSTQVPAPQAEKPRLPSEDFDPELDEVAKINWQKAMRMLTQKEAEKIADARVKAALDERDQKQAQNQTLLARASQIEASKQRVLRKYPSLADETSDEFQQYVQVLNENPDLRENSRGPELVMYEMEQRLSAQKPDLAQQEAQRLKRVAAGQVPASRSSSGKKTITLTQEEFELCQREKISPARYAQMKEANLKEGVSA